MKRNPLQTATLLSITILVGLAVYFFCVSRPFSGPDSMLTYKNQIDALEAGYNEYLKDFQSPPPLQNPKFFEALEGENPLGKLYVKIRAVRDSQGKILDPWGRPFIITLTYGNLNIYSEGREKK